jgi:hypothetical protein
MRTQTVILSILATALLALSALAESEPNSVNTRPNASDASTNLITQYDSGVGITYDSSPIVGEWADQATAGGNQNFTATFSMRPTLTKGVTPLGKDALHFNGADSNPMQMKFDATSAFDSAPSFTFMMVLKPTSSPTTDDWYIQSKVSNAYNNFGWGLWHDSSGSFAAHARNTTYAFNSTIADSTLGGKNNEWMILTGVYDNATTTIQLFLTDSDGVLHTATAVTVTGGLANGTHQLTSIGADINRSHAGQAEIAAIRIWNKALAPDTRKAVEMELYKTYIK